MKRRGRSPGSGAKTKFAGSRTGKNLLLANLNRDESHLSGISRSPSNSPAKSGKRGRPSQKRDPSAASGASGHPDLSPNSSRSPGSSTSAGSSPEGRGAGKKRGGGRKKGGDNWYRYEEYTFKEKVLDFFGLGPTYPFMRMHGKNKKDRETDEIFAKHIEKTDKLSWVYFFFLYFAVGLLLADVIFPTFSAKNLTWDPVTWVGGQISGSTNSEIDSSGIGSAGRSAGKMSAGKMRGSGGNDDDDMGNIDIGNGSGGGNDKTLFYERNGITELSLSKIFGNDDNGNGDGSSSQSSKSGKSGQRKSGKSNGVAPFSLEVVCQARVVLASTLFVLSLMGFL